MHIARMGARRLLILAALGVCCAASLPSIAAAAGLVTGSVETADGRPVTSTGRQFHVNWVKPLGDATDWYRPQVLGWPDSICAADTGRYALRAPAEGAFIVTAYDPTGEWAYQYFDGSGTIGEATLLSAPLDQDVTCDFILRPAAQLTGSVTSSGGKPLAGIEVVAMSPGGGGGDATTATDGSYRIGGLAAGDYRLRFTDPAGTVPARFYDGASGSTRTFTLLAVGEGETLTGIDVTMKRGWGPKRLR